MVFLGALCSSAQKVVNISGVINGLGSSLVYLGNKPNGISNTFIPVTYDSVCAHNDSFEFKNFRFTEVSYYSLEYPGYKGWLPFLIDTGNITIIAKKDSLYLGTVNGSNEEKVLEEYQSDIYFPFHDKNDRFIDSADKYLNSDTTRYKYFRKVVDSASSDFLKQQKAFIKAHPDKYTSLDILANHFKSFEEDSLKFYFYLLSPELQNNSAATDIKYRINAFAANMRPGAKVPDFSFISTDGKNRNLYKIRAKFKLINFWASWCAPCIAELPSLRNIDSVFKNVAIISFSLDTKKTEWIEANRKNHITWYSFSDLKGTSGKFVSYFGVQQIPLAVLLNEKNEIVKYNPELMEVINILHLNP